MPFFKYYIDFKNFEEDDIRIELKRLQSEPEDTLIQMEGGTPVATLETVEQDADKTKSVRGRRLTIVFNSATPSFLGPPDSSVFAEDEIDWQGRLITDSAAVPFIGNLVKDDISEAFQPKPNPTQLRCGDGFGVLKNIELTESDGDIIRGHFRLIELIWLCLRQINYDEVPCFVAFNLYEQDTDPVTSHAFFDTFLDALTFETDPNKRDDLFTVLEKILDAMGCFITFTDSAYYIIRWDEWDDSTGSVTTLRFAEFSMTSAGPAFVGYSTVDVDKNIAADYDPDYDGHFLSFDSALKSYQIKYSAVRHIYKFEQPKEIPCNSNFLNGTIISDTPTLKTYEIECWSMFKGPPNVTNDGTSYIRVVLNGGQETERFVAFEVQPTNLQYYIESQPIPVIQYDKFALSVDIRHDGQVETAAGTGNYNMMQIRLYANDSTYYTYDPIDDVTTIASWVASDSTWSTNNRYFKRFFDGTEDDTQWNTVGNDLDGVAAIPKDGYITICLHQTKKSDQFETHFSNLRFKIYPIVDGTYDLLQGQQTQVGFDGGKTLEKQFYLGESPHPIYKGALKKFNGDYVLTEAWQNFNDIFVLSDIGGTLARFIGYQWYNQFKRTRTVIESEVQGLTDTIPSQINRWFIKHGGQDAKYFMLTSFTGMDFATCGWHGVFIETSNGPGDRSYSGATDPTFLNFKYIR